jgi:hypothetical protein
MKSLKYYLLPLLLLIFFTACNSTKELKKEETNSTVECIEENLTTSETKRTNNKTKTTKSRGCKIDINHKNSLEQALKHYLEALQNFDTDAIVNMTYPRLFSVINRELFQQYLSTMINSNDIQITSYTTTPPQRSSIRRFSNGTEFAQIGYNSTISLQFLNPNLYASREQMSYLYDVEINKFGEGNVVIDLDNRVLRVTKPERLLAIKEQGGEWKFIGDDARYRKFFPRFMPPEILQNIE